ncbi:MAG: hypothetical protein HY710_11735 [Candidatus Latescibacteria bacterium]|nr:hypothetical protein [Candidatus Latescibacterota bacterium]
MTTSDLQQRLEGCVEQLKTGTLTEPALRALVEPFLKPKRQNLLYLQASNSSVGASVIGMSIVEDGTISDGPSDPAEWPYKRVLDAINDGWRVIQFPNLALLLDESRTYAFGYEFILER